MYRGTCLFLCCSSRREELGVDMSKLQEKGLAKYGSGENPQNNSSYIHCIAGRTRRLEIEDSGF